jgi:hypothetical protein
MDVLFLKENIDSHVLQFAYDPQNRHRIPRKSGNGLREYEVNLPSPAVIQHTLKVRSVILCACHRFIRIYAAVNPTASLLNKVAVILVQTYGSWGISVLPQSVPAAKALYQMPFSRTLGTSFSAS